MKLIPLVSLGLTLLLPPFQEGATGKETKIPLAATTFKKGQYRSGFDFKTDPPLQGWKATVGSESFVFVDMDGDGALTVDKDGLGLSSAPFVVPIPKVLLTRGGQFEIGFDGTRNVTVARQDLGAFAAIVPDVAVLSTIRIQSGVRPARLDPEKSSACEKHVEYLKANGFAGKPSGAFHEEDPGKKGYTPEGAKAADSCWVDAQAAGGAQALMGWYQSFYHRTFLVHAHLKTFGFAFKHGIAMYHMVERNFDYERNQCHPPDGATGVPPSFTAKGESPNPVPKSDKAKGCGFPIIILLNAKPPTLDSFVVVEGSGRGVAGTVSGPGRPANPEWPKNGGSFAFIPARPLAPNTTYKVKVMFYEPDQPALEWSFTTGR